MHKAQVLILSSVLKYNAQARLTLQWRGKAAEDRARSNGISLDFTLT